MVDEDVEACTGAISMINKISVLPSTTCVSISPVLSRRSATKLTSFPHWTLESKLFITITNQ